MQILNHRQINLDFLGVAYSNPKVNCLLTLM